MAHKLYEITLKGTYFAQVVINRWNYYVPAIDGDAATANQLANAFGMPVTAGDFREDSVLAAIQAFQTSNMIYSSLFIRDVFSETDFTERFPDAVGAVVGEAQSPVLSLGFRTDIKRLNVGRGMKRLAGVAEGATGTGGSITGTYITAGELIATRMSETIADAGADVSAAFIPCVAGKLKYVVPGSDPVRYAYKYFPDIDTQFDHLGIGVTWEMYDQVRTQGSRQYGRGI
jgi:hypothetical protein